LSWPEYALARIINNPLLVLRANDIVDTILLVDPILLLSACNLYKTSPDELIPLSGGHYNAVYQFPVHQTSQIVESDEIIDGDTFAILRIGVEDCPISQTLSILEWVRFLKREGAPVAAPRTSINNHLVESLRHYGTLYTVTVFEKAEGRLAENIPTSEWSTDLFQSIGKAVGKFHRISARYQPDRHSPSRPQWFESYEIHEATEKLTTSADPTRDKLTNLIQELQHLPTSLSDFSLIHGDLHFANFLIQSDGTVTIIDFDDCVYGWFAMDVAMALFDVLVLYNPTSKEDSRLFAGDFLSNYLFGYRQENDLSTFWQNQIPKFLKLKELCIYSDLIGHDDIALPDSWVGRFMRNRAARIANDIPYVDIDFTRL
jgi:Ser/Thr protein kinase RdoA (MazF antagonist)